MPCLLYTSIEKETFIVSLCVTFFAAVICMQIIARIGITPNTSIIGALIAMSIARIPSAALSKFRNLDRQNLVQTMTSAGGFAAANCGLLAVGILYAFGDLKLLVPMLLGSTIATLLGIYFVYKVYDSELFPACLLYTSVTGEEEQLKPKKITSRGEIPSPVNICLLYTSP